MIEDYEKNITDATLEFRDDYKPIPLPRNKKIKTKTISNSKKKC